ncbi:MAG: PD40 domain-containing protein [Bacteroidales bacterium]|nr:PD40 domain-containing protein [Bacteroidales bacterium]
MIFSIRNSARNIKEILCIALVVLTSLLYGQNSSWKYYGQKLPGNSTELFAPEIINHLAHSSPSSTPDGKEMYWSTVSGENETRKIYYVKFENNKWSEPILASFSGNYHDDQPFISYDGEKLFFASKRPKAKNGTQENDIWISNKTEQGWDDPKPIRNIIGLWTPTVTLKGTIYFLDLIDGTRVICSAELKNGDYAELEILNKKINKKGVLNWCPFIAPDESYLIFSSDREGQFGSGDLYISFRDEKGEWQEPINMGTSVNTDKQERFSGVSPDGKYLFFTRWNSAPYYHDIYWVEASIIEKLKNE